MGPMAPEVDVKVTNDGLRTSVGIVIVTLWVMLVVVSTVDPGRPVPAGVQALMMLVAGYLFAPKWAEAFRGRGEPKGGGGDDG